jgi:hypothetical protein
MGMMTDIGTQHPKNDILSDVGGMVGDAFKIACHQKRI